MHISNKKVNSSMSSININKVVNKALNNVNNYDVQNYEEIDYNTNFLNFPVPECLNYEKVINDNFIPKGITSTDKYTLIGSYDNNNNSRIYVYDKKTGKYLFYIKMSNNSKITGTSFDKNNNILYITDDTNNITALNWEMVEKHIHNNGYKLKENDGYLNFEKAVEYHKQYPTMPSMIIDIDFGNFNNYKNSNFSYSSFNDKYLYIGNTENNEAIKYELNYDKNNNKIEITNFTKFETPKNTRDIEIYSTNNKNYIFYICDNYTSKTLEAYTFTDFDYMKQLYTKNISNYYFNDNTKNISNYYFIDNTNYLNANITENNFFQILGTNLSVSYDIKDLISYEKLKQDPSVTKLIPLNFDFNEMDINSILEAMNNIEKNIDIKYLIEAKKYNPSLIYNFFDESINDLYRTIPETSISPTYSLPNYKNIKEDSFMPQGYTYNENYIFIGAYDDTPIKYKISDKINLIKKITGDYTRKKSRIYVYDRKTGEYLYYIETNNKSHMGGVSFDKNNNILYITNGDKDITALNWEMIDEYLINNKKHLEHHGFTSFSNIDSWIKTTNAEKSFKIDTTGINMGGVSSSYSYCDGKYLYIGHCDKIEENPEVRQFELDYDKENNKLNIKNCTGYPTPEYVQGISTYSKYGNNYMIFSSSMLGSATLDITQYSSPENMKNISSINLTDFHSKGGIQGINIDENGFLHGIYEFEPFEEFVFPVENCINPLLNRYINEIYKPRDFDIDKKELAEFGYDIIN